MPPRPSPSGQDHIARFTLPVSRLGLAVRHPTGIEDLLLAECADDDAAALALAERLALAEDGTTIAWAELAATDLDALLLRLRQALLGDRIITDLRCGGTDCGRPIDISFSIEAFLAHHRPRTLPRHVLPAAGQPGWFRVASQGLDEEVQFRVPTVADQLAARRQRDPAAALAGRCIRARRADSRSRRRVEAAMQALAPALSVDLQGQCPECGAVVQVRFEPRAYCVQELRARARFIHQDVDVLARRYHWSEPRILAMPASRRARYVELALAGGGA